MNFAGIIPSQCLADIENLVTKLKPEDGPGLRGVLTACLSGISESDCLTYDDHCRLRYLTTVFKLLWDGRYEILPAHRDGISVITAEGYKNYKIPAIVTYDGVSNDEYEYKEKMLKEFSEDVFNKAYQHGYDIFMVVSNNQEKSKTVQMNFLKNIDVSHAIDEYKKFHKKPPINYTWRDLYAMIINIHGEDPDSVTTRYLGSGKHGHYTLQVYPTLAQVTLFVSASEGKMGDAEVIITFDGVKEEHSNTYTVTHAKITNVDLFNVAHYTSAATVSLDEEINKTLNFFIRVRETLGQEKAENLAEILNEIIRM